MKTQHIVAAVVGVIVVVAAIVVLRGSPSEDVAAGPAAPPPKAAAAPLSPVAVAAPEKPDEAGKIAIEKLWPHLKDKQPTDADREKVKAEWKAFAAKYPNNMYIPAEFRPALSEAEQKAARKQLDDVTAVAASNATAKYVGKGQEIPAGASAGSMPKPPTVTEQQAREKGITPEQQRAFFNYKIQELESRIQLGEFYLSSSAGDAAAKQQMQKEMAQWKKELDELNKVRATIPKS